MIFVRRLGLKDDRNLVDHEYVHIMQYAANATFIDEYLGANAGRLEAIAYLWSAWLDNCREFGGLTSRGPMKLWKVPTRQHVGEHGRP